MVKLNIFNFVTLLLMGRGSDAFMPRSSSSSTQVNNKATVAVKSSPQGQEAGVYDGFFSEASDLNIAPPLPVDASDSAGAMEMATGGGGAPAAVALPPPPDRPAHHRQAINVGPLLGYDKGYPWLTILGPHYHFDTRENYVERHAPGQQGQAINVGPLLGLDKGYPWNEALARQPVALRTQYQEAKPFTPPGQALNIGPLLGEDKGFPWKEAMARLPVALRTHYVETGPKTQSHHSDVGPLLLLDKGASWNLGPGAMERCRMETFVQ